MKDHYCTGFNASVMATDTNGDYLIYRPRCKQWSCPYCAGQNRKLWRYRIMLECEKTIQNVWFFWTITLDGSDHKSDNPQIDSLMLWRERWDKLMKRVRRDMKKLSTSFKYVRVFESHKSGILHVHMLSNVAYGDIQECDQWNNKTKQNDKVWRSESLATHLDELELGNIHDVRPIVTEDETDNGVARNVSAYVTKYLTKDIQSGVRNILKDAGMSRVRMIQTSQKFGEIPENEDKLNWELSRLQHIAFDNMPAQNKAIDISREVQIEDEDFYGGDAYPNKISDTVWLSTLIDDG